MLLATNASLIGVPFLNIYILLDLLILPDKTLTPGTTVGASVGFLLFKVKI
jgi:hypothetical protein